MKTYLFNCIIICISSLLLILCNKLHLSDPKHYLIRLLSSVLIISQGIALMQSLFYTSWLMSITVSACYLCLIALISRRFPA